MITSNARVRGRPLCFANVFFNKFLLSDFLTSLKQYVQTFFQHGVHRAYVLVRFFKCPLK